MHLPLSRLPGVFLTLCCALLPVAQVVAQQSDELIPRIATLLATQMETIKNQPERHIKILTPHDKLAGLCPQPELRLAGHPARITGNRSVIARCSQKQTFIQIQVSASGTWWIAARTLVPGDVISAEDIAPVTGELDSMPGGLLFDAAQITGTTPTRTIHPGQPLTENQLRRRWAVIANREVDVVAPGSGFLIHTKGKALSNAALNDTLRVQTRSGKVLMATASGEGSVTINMDN